MNDIGTKDHFANSSLPVDRYSDDTKSRNNEIQKQLL